jgi:Fe-S-cluster containining protein
MIAVDGASPCDGCAAVCCTSLGAISIHGGDLLRLTRGLGLRWDEVAQTVVHRSPLFRGFRLSGGHERIQFVLAQVEGGERCRFLVEREGAGRCSIYPHRPTVCRSYPLVAGADGAPEVEREVVCPDGRARGFDLAAPDLAAAVDDDVSGWELYFRIVDRWDEAARRVDPAAPLPMDTYLSWLASLYDALASMRNAPPREFQAAAFAQIRAAPLPRLP